MQRISFRLLHSLNYLLNCSLKRATSSSSVNKDADDGSSLSKSDVQMQFNLEVFFYNTSNTHNFLKDCRNGSGWSQVHTTNIDCLLHDGGGWFRETPD